MRSIRGLGAAVACAAGLLLVPSAALALPHSDAQGLGSRHVCDAPAAGAASCNALLVTNSSGQAFNGQASASSSIAGYHPSDLQSAYDLPSSTAGTGQTVAIVDAYNDPDAASDIATYRSEFGLPAVTTCSVSSGKVVSPGGPCFVRVSNTGSTTSLPRSNGGWAEEISLDIDMVSAICPNCNIALVEASSSSLSALGTAENEATKLGANEIPTATREASREATRRTTPSTTTTPASPSPPAPVTTATASGTRRRRSTSRRSAARR